VRENNHVKQLVLALLAALAALQPMSAAAPTYSKDH
jgi:hypothetical protein